MDFIFFELKDGRMLPSSKQAPFLLLSSKDCISSTFPLQSRALELAYNTKLLDPQIQYLSFCFPTLQHLQCFFFPTSSLPNVKGVLLDLFLPPLLQIPCAIFAYEKYWALCFYQNDELCYYKNIHSEEEIFQSLNVLQTLFDLREIPVTLFDYGWRNPCFDFALSIPLKHQALIPKHLSPLLPLHSPHLPTQHLLRFCLFSALLLSAFWIALIGFSPPPSPPLPPPKIPQSLNASVPLFSLLAFVLPLLTHEPLLALEFEENIGLTLNFSTPFSSQLLKSLSSKGYTTNILDPLTLRIVL